MGPLEALGVAAATAQLIDFGATLIRCTKEIVDTGSTVSNEHASTITSDFIKATASIDHQLSSKTSAGNDVSVEEQASTYLWL